MCLYHMYDTKCGVRIKELLRQFLLLQLTFDGPKIRNNNNNNNNNNSNNNKTIFIQVNLFSKNEFAAINQGPVKLMYLRYKSYNNIV